MTTTRSIDKSDNDQFLKLLPKHFGYGEIKYFDLF